MDRKNEKTLVTLGDAELGAVAGGFADTTVNVDASHPVNTGVIVGVQVPIAISLGGSAETGGTNFGGFIGQFGGKLGA